MNSINIRITDKMAGLEDIAWKEARINAFREKEIPSIMQVLVDDRGLEAARETGMILADSLLYENSGCHEESWKYEVTEELKRILSDNNVGIICFYGYKEDEAVYFIEKGCRQNLSDEMIGKMKDAMNKRRSINLDYLKGVYERLNNLGRDERKDMLKGFPNEFSNDFTKKVAVYLGVKDLNFPTAVLAGMLISDITKEGIEDIPDMRERMQEKLETKRFLASFCHHLEESKIFPFGNYARAMKIYKAVADELGLRSNIVTG